MRNYDSLRRRLTRWTGLLLSNFPAGFVSATGRWLLLVGGWAVLLTVGTSASAVSVTLAWDSSPDPSVIGYKVYYGTQSQNYTSVVVITNGTSVQITDLVIGTTYYFSATTLNNVGLESGFSGELTYLATAPYPPPASLQISRAQGKVQIEVTGPPGYVYELETTADLEHWVIIDSIGLDDAGTGLLSYSQASSGGWYYRLRQISP